MPLTQTLSRLVAGDVLSREEAGLLMEVLAEGSAPLEQVAGVLVALQCRGATPAELAGFAEQLQARAMAVSHGHASLVDTCGTGGGVPSFNISTGAALLAAAAGAKVAKHGNRSVTSQCGSADVLEELGVRLVAEPERLGHILDTVGIVFLFAPHHHPSLKAVGQVRRALGIRTVFNQLGPLANPVGAKRQVIGVFEKRLLRPMAEALALLGIEHAFVVHGQDGLDEASAVAPTNFCEVHAGKVVEGVFEPSDFGVQGLLPNVLAPGGSVSVNAKILQSALDYSDRGRALALIPTTALALYVAGAASLHDASATAHRTAESAGGAKLLAQLVEATAE